MFSALLISSVLVGTSLRISTELATGWHSVCTPEEGEKRECSELEIPHNWANYSGQRWYGHGDLHGSAVYTRSFDCALKTGQRAYLVFDGVGSYLTVKVNGRELCRHKPAGKVVTTLDATEAIAADGRNELEVLCEHPSQIIDMPWVCGGCSAAYCEGPEPLGLFRMVHVEVTDEVRIAPFGVFVWGKAPFETVHVETEILNASGAACERGLSVSCSALGVDGHRTVALAAGETKTVKLEFPVRNVHRWSAEDPFLYDFTVTLGRAGTALDSETVTTGFREVSWPFLRDTKDRRLFVNRKPVFIHGVCENDHLLGASAAFGPEEIDARAKLVKETLHFNAVRDGHEPHDLRWGHNWDRLGVYWWPQFGTHNYYDNPDFIRNYREMLKQWMKERRNSPSVVIWGIQNESVLPAKFAHEITRFIHEYDPSSSTLDRLTTTCNYGDGADWLVTQNWSGTYEGEIEKYGEELATDQQLLNGEYGAYRNVGYHGEAPTPETFDVNGEWTEEHGAYILHRKAVLAWKNRENLCGHFQWLLFTHENPGRQFVEEGYRLLDKIGPTNHKGIMSLWGAPTSLYYMYRAYGDAFAKGTLGEIIDLPLMDMVARGKALDAPKPGLKKVSLAADRSRRYLYRLNCGGDDAVDAEGNAWIADSTFFSESWAGTKEFAAPHLDPLLASQGELTEGVVNAEDADSAILSTYRWGRDRLRFFFKVQPLRQYRIEAWFVEPGGYGHVFDVAVNGRRVETAFDLTAEAGMRGAAKRVWTVESGEDGRLEIAFPKVQVCQAVISAIAISEDANGEPTAVTVGKGYPASANRTWKELTSKCRSKMDKKDMPFYDKRLRIPVQPIAEIQDLRSSCFVVNLSNMYSIRFKLRHSAVPRNDIWWEMLRVAGRVLVSEGGLTIPKTDKEIVYEVPVDKMINAGTYLVRINCPDGVLIEATEMFETPGKGQ